MSTNSTRTRIRRSAGRLAILFGILLAPSLVVAQAGAWDYGFSADGYVIVDEGEGDDWVRGVTVQFNGKVVIVGYVEQTFPEINMIVARFNMDGSLDESFNGDGVGIFSDVSAGYDVEILPDGKMVLLASTSDGPVLMRLTEFGYPDNEFDQDGRVEYDFPEYPYGTGQTLAVYPDGRILLGGGSSAGTGQYYFLAARFHPDGSLDNTFSVDGRTSVLAGNEWNSRYTTMEMFPSGGFALIGTHDPGPPEHSQYLRFVRHMVNGDLDMGSGLNGVVDDALGMDSENIDIYPTGSAALHDGSLLVCGSRGYPDYDGFVVKYLNDGTRDPTFSFDGLVLVQGGVSNLVVQPDGKILASIYSGFVRLLPNGALDLSFGVNGVVDAGSSALYQTPIDLLSLAPDGKILSAGFGRILENDDDRSILVCRFLNDLNIGIAEFSAAGNTLVYPNPVGEVATFGYTLHGAEKITCELHDAEGRVVRTYLKGIHRSAGTHSETLDLHGIAAGRYTILLSNSSGSTATSIIKN